MLEPCDGKLSRTVLRGEGSRKAPDLPGARRQHVSSTDLLAVLSLLIAGLAALYARRAWSEAHRANDIALHSGRIDIHRALGDLRYVMQTRGLRVETQEVTRFLRLARESKFYFSEPKTSERLKEYFDVCFALGEYTRKLSRQSVTAEQSAALHEEQDMLCEREEQLFREYVEGELYNAIKVRSRLA